MQLTPIQQGTQEWLEAKQKTVGGSEIYALVLGLCTAEEINKVFPNFEAETSFSSPLLIGLKFFFGQTPDIAEIDRLYGNAMEKPSVAWFNEIYKGVASCQHTRNFHFHEKYKQASCSPDGYITLTGSVNDRATGESITSGLGLMEIKTVRREAGFESEPKMQYLIQACWNAYVCGLDWFSVFLTYAKDFELEKELHKGKRIAYAEMNNIEKIKEELESKTYFYKVNNAVINLCLRALSRFIEKYNQGTKLPYAQRWTVFEFSKNPSVFEKEKSIISGLADHELQATYGSREATEEEAQKLKKRYSLLLKQKENEKEINEIEAYFLRTIKDNSAINAYAGEEFEMYVKRSTKNKSGLSFKNTTSNIVKYITRRHN